MSATIQLSQLLAGTGAELSRDCVVTDISLSSNTLRSGELFVARQGGTQHGAYFAEQAVAAGAVAVLHDGLAALPPLPADIAVVELTNLDDQLGRIAARFFTTDEIVGPLVAVTGTNGKTSCALNYANLSNALGTPCGVIGTLGWGIPPQLEETGLTTPDIVTVHRSLANMHSAGCAAFAVEASSHALDQGRLECVPITTAVFTNLSRDHLDYHGDFDSYAAAKTRLFYWPGLRNVVINADDEYSPKLLRAVRCSGESITYATESSKADIVAESIELTGHGIKADLRSPWGVARIELTQIGRFSLQNALAVIGALCLEGAELDSVVEQLPSLRPVPGRMQVFGPEPGPHLLVDYAHTPDALEKVLQSLSEHCDAQLWLVFGCGGDRDRGKRAEMAAIAEAYAQHIIVTSDNPRSEDPQAIIDDIVCGFSQQAMHNGAVSTQVDRHSAIEQAVCHSADRDWVLIAGKGHEKYQQIGSEKIPFDDVLVAQAALQKRASARSGMSQ